MCNRFYCWDENTRARKLDFAQQKLTALLIQHLTADKLSDVTDSTL